MKKQLAMGFVMSLALTQMTLAGLLKPVETRKSTETSKETAKGMELKAQSLKLETIADKTRYLVSISGGTADPTRLKGVLSRDTIVVTQEGGTKRTYSMAETADLVIKVDQELRSINVKDLSSQARALHDARQAAVESIPEFMATAARRSDFKLDLPERTQKEVEAYNQQLSLAVDMLTNPKWNAKDIISHVKVMKATSQLVKESRTPLDGDLAYSMAVGGGKRASEERIKEISPCNR